MDFLPSSEEFARLFRSEYWPDVRLAEQIILERIDTIKTHTSPLWGMIKTGKSIDTTKPFWLNEVDYPHELVGTLSAGGTFTVTGNLFGATASRTNMLKVVRQYATLRYDSGGTTCIAYVSAVDATDPIITLVADSGTSLPSNGTGQTWVLTGEPATDAEPASNPRFLDRDFSWAASELFTDTFSIELTRKGTKMVAVPNELTHQLDMLLERQEKLKARAGISQWPILDGSGDPKSTMESERARLCGLDWWPEYYFGSGKKWEDSGRLLDIGGVRLDQPHFDTMVNAIEDAGGNLNEGKWVFATRPEVVDQMQDYGLAYRQMTQDSTTAGFSIERIKTKRGAIITPIRDYYIPRGSGLLLDVTAVETRPFNDMGFLKGQIPTNNITSEMWEIACRLVGVIIRKGPIKIAKVKNIGS